MLLEKTLEVSVSKFEELCKTDARMETLKAYISNEENGYIKLDTVKAIIGLPVKHEDHRCGSMRNCPLMNWESHNIRCIRDLQTITMRRK